MPSGHIVTLCGIGGLTFPRLLHKSVRAPGYQVVLLEFGSNDLVAGCKAVSRHGLVSGGYSPFLPWTAAQIPEDERKPMFEDFWALASYNLQNAHLYML